VSAPERVRGFPAFPATKGRTAARTWWGRAWTAALEDTSLDQVRLRRGRGYARSGLVGPIAVSPGQLTASVRDTSDALHRTVVRVEQLTDREWRRLLDRVAARPEHLAALLAGEVPRDLVATADDLGVRLLPGVGDLDPECDCDDWGFPCAHAAALCYQAAWLLDADPFVLLLLRGRAESELVTTPASSTVEDAGDSVARVFATTPAALPPPPPPVTEPAPPLRIPAPPGLPPGALPKLAADAAARARALLAATHPVE
jgi:uncharacterized Zn finger protein